MMTIIINARFTVKNKTQAELINRLSEINISINQHILYYAKLNTIGSPFHKALGNLIKRSIDALRKEKHAILAELSSRIPHID